MLKKTIAGIVAACVTCCTVPLLFPALAGVSIFGFQLFRGPLSLDTIVCAVALAALAFVAVYLACRFFLSWTKKAKPACTQAACQVDGKCGCKPGA